MSFEERDDRLDQVRSPSHDITKQMLLVVVVPRIREYASHTKESGELTET